METSCSAQSGVVGTLLSPELPSFFSNNGFAYRNDRGFFGDGPRSSFHHSSEPYGDGISLYDNSLLFRQETDSCQLPCQLFCQVASPDGLHGFSSPDVRVLLPHYDRPEESAGVEAAYAGEFPVSGCHPVDLHYQSLSTEETESPKGLMGNNSASSAQLQQTCLNGGFSLTNFGGGALSAELVNRKRAASSHFPSDCGELSPSLLASNHTAFFHTAPHSSPELSTYLPHHHDGTKADTPDGFQFPHPSDNGSSLSSLDAADPSIASLPTGFGSVEGLMNLPTAGASLPGTPRSLGPAASSFNSPPLLEGSLRIHRCPPNLKRYRRSKHLDDQDIASPSDFDSKEEIVAYVEHKLETMDESFTFKSATYQTHLKRFLPRPDEKQRKYIERIDSFPRIPASLTERRELVSLRKVDPSMAPDGRLDDCRDGFTIKERLDEMLTSLVNKIMFLLVVKFDTWYIHAPAREQIREQLLEFIWPSLPELHVFFREHFTFFIDMRIRHFRDSVARYFRDRPRPDGGKGSMFSGGLGVQSSMLDAGFGGCMEGVDLTPVGASGMFSSTGNGASNSLQGAYLLPSMDAFDFSKQMASHEDALEIGQSDFGKMPMVQFGGAAGPSLVGSDMPRVSPIAAGSPVDLGGAATASISNSDAGNVACMGFQYASMAAAAGGQRLSSSVESPRTVCEGLLPAQADASLDGLSSGDAVPLRDGRTLSSVAGHEGYRAFTFPAVQGGQRQPPQAEATQGQAAQRFVPYFTSSPSMAALAPNNDAAANDGGTDKHGRKTALGRNRPGQGLVLGHPVCPKAVGRPCVIQQSGTAPRTPPSDSPKPAEQQLRSLRSLPLPESSMSELRSPMLSYRIEGVAGAPLRRSRRRLGTPTHFMSSMPPLMPMTAVALSHTGSAGLRRPHSCQAANGEERGGLDSLQAAQEMEKSTRWRWSSVAAADGRRRSRGASCSLLPRGEALHDDAKDGSRKVPQVPALVGPLVLPLPSGYLSSLVSVNSQVDSFPMSGRLLDSRRVS